MEPQKQPFGVFDRVIVPVLGHFAALVLFCLMVLTCIDVVGRYFFSMPVTGGFEMTEILLASLIFAGLPLVTLETSTSPSICSIRWCRTGCCAPSTWSPV